MARCSIASSPSLSRHRHRVIAPSRYRHRTIAPSPSRYRSIVIAPSRHRHRAIASSHHRPTSRWYDGAMARWCDGDDAIEHRAIVIAPSSSCHRTIALSGHRHRAIVIAPSTYKSMVRWRDSEVYGPIRIPYFSVNISFKNFIKEIVLEHNKQHIFYRIYLPCGDTLGMGRRVAEWGYGPCSSERNCCQLSGKYTNWAGKGGGGGMGMGRGLSEGTAHAALNGTVVSYQVWIYENNNKHERDCCCFENLPHITKYHTYANISRSNISNWLSYFRISLEVELCTLWEVLQLWWGL